jgi:hypothetical protein
MYRTEETCYEGKFLKLFLPSSMCHWALSLLAVCHAEVVAQFTILHVKSLNWHRQSKVSLVWCSGSVRNGTSRILIRQRPPKGWGGGRGMG